MTGHTWKCLGIVEIGWNGLKWLEMAGRARIAGVSLNSWNWLDSQCSQCNKMYTASAAIRASPAFPANSANIANTANSANIVNTGKQNNTANLSDFYSSSGMAL